MNIHAPHAVALAAVAPNRDRPATTIIHDGPDARLVVFRIGPGQRVPPHTSVSTVILTVISGSGSVTGGVAERPVGTGDVIVFERGELHGMEAGGEVLVILATIAPRPGSR
jgi:quercetin dioxygenase-like cupin family protein